MTTSRGRRTQKRAAERAQYKAEQERLKPIQKSYRTKKSKKNRKAS